MHRILPVLLLPCLLSFTAHAQRALTMDRSTMFSGAGNCQMCHAMGNGANISSRGEDVAPPTDWRSTMMANAARDPYWQAAVSAEVMDHPELRAVIEDKCTNCHTPMGHEEAHANGAPSYSLDEARGNALAMDAVSCTLCHQVTGDNFGTAESFSGGYAISSTRVTFGPYQNPLIQPMKNISGFEPVHSAHIEQAEHCATCHTLFTPFLDGQGQIAGEFPEQTPYLEWKASAYPALGIRCQSCHMPVLDEAMRISTMPQTAPQRRPVFKHHFAGGNVFMLEIMKTHALEIGATAEDMHFDSTIARTQAQLTRNTVALTAPVALDHGATLEFSVEVQNLTGHKFPTGYPSRRAWLHVTVRDAANAVVFESGAWSAEGIVPDVDAPFEPHREEIAAAGEVPVWEAVMGDVDGNPTERLLHAARYLKDNRIPPRGFARLAAASDTIGVVGVGEDTDYQVVDGVAFAGSDRVHYRIAIDPAAPRPYTVRMELCYQSIKPEFITNLARHDTPEIRRLRGYHAAAASPVQVIAALDRVSTEVSAVDPLAMPAIASLALYPQPPRASAGVLTVAYELTREHRDGRILLTDLLGRTIMHRAVATGPGRHTQTLDITSLRPGMYFAMLVVGKERRGTALCILP